MSITAVSGQGNATGSDTGVTSLTTTALPSGVTQGNLVIAGVKSGANGVTFTAPDSSWVSIVHNAGNSSNTKTLELFFLIVDSAHAGEKSWTWTQSSSHSFVVDIQEYSTSGTWPSSPIDQTNTSNPTTQSTTIDSSTSGTTTQGEELWLALLTYNLASQTETGLTSGWTNRQEYRTTAQTATVSLCDYMASATGGADCSYTIGTAEYNAGIVATLKDSVGTTHSVTATMGASTGGLAPAADVLVPTAAVLGESTGGLAPAADVLVPTAATLGATTGGLSPTANVGVVAFLGASTGGLEVSGDVVVPVSATLGASSGGLAPATTMTHTETVSLGGTTGGLSPRVTVPDSPQPQPSRLSGGPQPFTVLIPDGMSYARVYCDIYGDVEYALMQIVSTNVQTIYINADLLDGVMPPTNGGAPVPGYIFYVPSGAIRTPFQFSRLKQFVGIHITGTGSVLVTMVFRSRVPSRVPMREPNVQQASHDEGATS